MKTKTMKLEISAGTVIKVVAVAMATKATLEVFSLVSVRLMQPKIKKWSAAMDERDERRKP